MLVQHYGKQSGDFLKTKYRATISSYNPNPGHISGENHNSKRYIYLCFHYTGGGENEEVTEASGAEGMRSLLHQSKGPESLRAVAYSSLFGCEAYLLVLWPQLPVA